MKKLNHALIMMLMLVIGGVGVYADESWICPTCGEERTSNFCTEDGTPKQNSSQTVNNASGNSSGNSSGGYAVSFSDVSIGDTITLGTYEQDNIISNGPEDIEWIVLDVQDDRALMISKYELDVMSYDYFLFHVSWETCSLRSWLNHDFLNEAFTSDEKALIPAVTLTEEANSEYGTNSAGVTQDRVFLLSIPEVLKYFPSDNERKCTQTEYAYAKGVQYSEDMIYGWWWLRSSSSADSYATFVIYNGSITDAVLAPGDYNICVRPALWINLGGSD